MSKITENTAIGENYGIILAEAIIRLLEAQISCVSNMVAADALRTVKKEVLKMKEQIIGGKIEEVRKSWKGFTNLTK